MKMSAGICASLAIPGRLYAADQNILDQVVFNSSTYQSNRPKVILVFLYGGASELAGNFTNFSEIEAYSQTSYVAYFGNDNITSTRHGFWRYAGGDIMEDLVAASYSNFSVLRTCYSQIREEEGNRAHGICTSQNQRGSFTADTSGVFTNLSKILQKNGVIDSDSQLPILSMEGNSGFFAKGDLYVPAYLRPMDIDEELNNPYKRNDSGYQSFSMQMDALAQSLNPPGKIKTAFEKRQEMSSFIEDIKKNQTPAGAFGYDEDNPFANRLKTAIDVMVQNPDTVIVSAGSGGLGGWDDHSNGNNYPTRMNNLMNALKSAAMHLADQDKDGNISIIVMSEFGRGVNLNSSQGWDHGNLQNVYVIGGPRYFKKLGPHGETVVHDYGSVNRRYLRPAPGSYWFEPFAVASTIYSIFGVENPEILTENTVPISPLLKS